MTEIADTYRSVASKAVKILGAKAKPPKPPAALDKAVAAALDVEDDYDKNADTAEATTQDFVNLIVKLKSEARRYNAAVQKADFGLDAKDAKKADTVHKYFQSNFDKLNDHWDETLDKLEKQLDGIKEAAKSR